MNTTTRVLLFLGAIFVVGVLTLQVANAFRDAQLERSMADRCWIADGEWKDHSCYHKPNPFPEGGEWLCIKRDAEEDITCEDQKTGKIVKVNKAAAQDYIDWRKNKG